MDYNYGYKSRIGHGDLKKAAAEFESLLVKYHMSEQRNWAIAMQFSFLTLIIKKSFPDKFPDKFPVRGLMRSDLDCFAGSCGSCR
jgi:hypothetical protein